MRNLERLSGRFSGNSRVSPSSEVVVPAEPLLCAIHKHCCRKYCHIHMCSFLTFLHFSIAHLFPALRISFLRGISTDRKREISSHCICTCLKRCLFTTFYFITVRAPCILEYSMNEKMRRRAKIHESNIPASAITRPTTK